MSSAAYSLKGGVLLLRGISSCSGCGNCCSNILPLSPLEIQNIKAFILEHNIQQVHHQKNNENYDASCPFLNENKMCNIYRIRPLICKAFNCRLKSPKKKYVQRLAMEKLEVCDVRDTFFGVAQEVSQKLILQLLLNKQNLARRVIHEQIQ